MHQKTVLVTGASAGIGKATAQYFLDKGFQVFGTSRKATLPGMAQGGGIQMIRMDVNDETSVATAITYIMGISGKLDVVVLNAGNGIAGSIEDTSTEEAKFQLETNFFGAHRVIRHILPIMRKQGYGAIVAVSSVAGFISIPYQAFYSASKFAMEALIVALRHEIAPFGITASLVEPGDTKTDFTGSRVLADGAEQNPVYRDKFKRSVSRMEKDEQAGASPDSVARVIYHMATRKNPPVRKAVGFGYKTIAFLWRLLPTRLLEFAVSKLYG